MPAPLREVFGDRVERGGDVKVDGGTHGTTHLRTDEGGRDHGTGQLVRETAGHETEQPGCPRVVPQDEREVARRRGRRDPRAINRHLRHLAPLLVDGLELVGELRGALDIRLEQERHRQLGIRDPSRGIDARHDAVCQVARRRLVRRLARTGQQGAEPGV